MAEDVERFIQDHELSDPALIGHSMGAKVAMTVALRSITPISSLIPIDNAPIDAALKSDFGKYVRGMQAIDAADLDPKHYKSEADHILRKYEESLPIRQFLLTNLLPLPSPKLRTPSSPSPSPSKLASKSKFRIPLPTLSRSLPQMADFPFKDPSTHTFKKPTLFIRGTASHYISDEALPVIGEFFPRFELVDVVGAGHWVVSERPEEFRRGVVEFLRREA
ncbi:MAG: hypothetical protein Q9160_003976 [Pyrenula sp. 1 TL-2023]